MDICIKCGSEKASYFDKRRKKYYSRCGKCSYRKMLEKLATNPSYEKHTKLLAKKLMAKRREMARELVQDYLVAHNCVDCGEDRLLVLEFDHVRGEKSKDISRLIGSGAALSTIKKEIKKCDISLCELSSYQECNSAGLSRQKHNCRKRVC
jgi:hypothetical protein